MKTVIEHGKCKDKIPKETTCDNCGCKFTFTREDCYWSRPLLTYITSCPECDKEIWLGDIYD